mgnify:CR=1 FL=1
MILGLEREFTFGQTSANNSISIFPAGKPPEGKISASERGSRGLPIVISKNTTGLLTSLSTPAISDLPLLFIFELYLTLF